MRRSHPYMANSAEASRTALLDAVGVSDPDELFRQIPAEHRSDDAITPSRGIASEFELRRMLEGRLRGVASTDSHVSFLGGGYWKHHIPALCDEIASRPEISTSVWGTPSSDHGRNQAWFEFTSQVGALLDLEFVGLPVYSWGCAAGHALRMAARLTGRSVVVIPEGLDRERRLVIETYCGSRELGGSLSIREVALDRATGTVSLEALSAVLDEEVAGVYLETPNSWGVIEADIARIVDAAHAVGAETVVGVDPISLGALASPASFGADIVVGSLQPLGIPLNAGGGVGGFIASRDEERYARQFPTLQVSLAPTRREGERAFGMTLFAQSSYGARELGNDWTGNSVYLWAVRAAVYLALLGPQGMRELATTVARNARRTAALLAEVPGVSVRYADAIFKEFIVDFSQTGMSVSRINEELFARGILGGHDLSGSADGLDGCALYCVTEVTTEDDVTRLITALKEVAAS
ncbi:aminomethyl-transferring glycine dehydrogenase subunit GcvPA [Microbacterium sp. ET2]|uniref:aminomethyl-transferring glycine dehydrogenase subunit GcvPA n=1 Tax=Microbacterium albipurpureum TaxID=3050384 RepID=UPI00259CBA9D|nr:aminomethyl-transferring glycine dehydrogenase subunit GcvPA [Microbacterium sp. ET2 (Ac-2212)]WJL96331.1 aminomethyl-transferring glycine dehydrogenase subunit GcvPA [Microbacterium sp. ET2 (Ac-2212)]